MARLIAQAVCDVKAEDLKVLDLRKVSGFADYFVIASGRSAPTKPTKVWL